MRLALYSRVSTKQHGQDVENQFSELRLWAKLNKHTIVGEYADKGWSGSKEKRPELDRLMKDARRRLFDGVAVWKWDRFARSHAVHQLFSRAIKGYMPASLASSQKHN